jgi:hypothetical protein
MSIIRISHKKEYTCIKNTALRDRRLSFKARGIHHFLLSFPDKWQVNIDHIASESDKDGRTAVMSGLQELEELGYLHKERIRNERQEFKGWDYTIYETPSDNRHFESAEVGKPEVGKPEVGKPEVGKPDLIINNDQYQVLNLESNYSPPTPSLEGVGNEDEKIEPELEPEETEVQAPQVEQEPLQPKDLPNQESRNQACAIEPKDLNQDKYSGLSRDLQQHEDLTWGRARIPGQDAGGQWLPRMIEAVWESSDRKRFAYPPESKLAGTRNDNHIRQFLKNLRDRAKAGEREALDTLLHYQDVALRLEQMESSPPTQYQLPEDVIKRQEYLKQAELDRTNPEFIKKKAEFRAGLEKRLSKLKPQGKMQNLVGDTHGNR